MKKGIQSSSLLELLPLLSKLLESLWLGFNMSCFASLLISQGYFLCQARKDNGAAHALSKSEWLITVIITAGAIVGILLLVFGMITV